MMGPHNEAHRPEKEAIDIEQCMDEPFSGSRHPRLSRRIPHDGRWMRGGGDVDTHHTACEPGRGRALRCMLGAGLKVTRRRTFHGDSIGGTLLYAPRGLSS